MIVAGFLLAGAAALLHVYVFYLESIVWTGARARATFGTSPAEADATRELAFNQGFYNLFLAIAVALGIVLYAAGQHVAGATLVFTGTGSMVAAGTVLLLSSPSKASAALKQLALPLVSIVVLAIGLALR